MKDQWLRPGKPLPLLADNILRLGSRATVKSCCLHSILQHILPQRMCHCVCLQHCVRFEGAQLALLKNPAKFSTYTTLCVFKFYYRYNFWRKKERRMKVILKLMANETSRTIINAVNILLPINNICIKDFTSLYWSRVFVNYDCYIAFQKIV